MPTALSGEELDALIAHFDALVTKSLRRAIRAGTTEALTAASNLEQFHLPGGHNQETHGHGHGGEPRLSPFSPLIEPHDVKTYDQLQEVANGRQLPPDDNKWEHFYHSTRSSSEIDSIAESGVQAPQSGKNVFLSKDEVRDRGGGFVIVRVPRGSAIEGSDRVESGLTYREFTVKNVPPENVVRGIRSVTDSSGFKINEDELAKYALENQGSSSVADLPSEYRGWFNVKSMTAAGVTGPEQVDAEGEPHTGAMIALVPNDPESWTLEGGEALIASSAHVMFDRYVRDKQGQFAPKGGGGGGGGGGSSSGDVEADPGEADSVLRKNKTRLRSARKDAASDEDAAKMIDAHDHYVGTQESMVTNEVLRGEISQLIDSGHIREPRGDRPGNADEVIALHRERASDLSHLIDKYGVENSKPMLVHRGVHTQHARDLRNLKPGDTVSNAGFTSTSSKSSVVGDMHTSFPGSVHMEITVPAGVKTIGGNGREHELILDKGIKLRYTGRTSEDHLKFEVVP